MRNRLEEMRNPFCWTRQELTGRAQVSRQTIISLEGGRYNPSILPAACVDIPFGVSLLSALVDEERL